MVGWVKMSYCYNFPLLHKCQVVSVISCIFKLCDKGHTILIICAVQSFSTTIFVAAIKSLVKVCFQVLQTGTCAGWSSINGSRDPGIQSRETGVVMPSMECSLKHNYLQLGFCLLVCTCMLGCQKKKGCRSEKNVIW